MTLSQSILSFGFLILDSEHLVGGGYLYVGNKLCDLVLVEAIRR